MQYAAEIWGWQNWKELEKIQACYMKQTLHLDKFTPEYALNNETNREKIGIISGERAIKYDAKLRQGK